MWDRRGATAIVLGLVMLTRGAARATTPTPCPGGHFASQRGPIFGGDGVVSDGSFDVAPCSAAKAVVTVPSCGTVAAHISTHGRATHLTSRWTRCKSFGGRVKVDGRI